MAYQAEVNRRIARHRLIRDFLVALATRHRLIRDFLVALGLIWGALAASVLADLASRGLGTARETRFAAAVVTPAILVILIQLAFGVARVRARRIRWASRLAIVEQLLQTSADQYGELVALLLLEAPGEAAFDLVSSTITRASVQVSRGEEEEYDVYKLRTDLVAAASWRR